MKLGSFVILILALWISAAHAGTPYDADPRHLWNRLDEALFVRTAPGGERYGIKELDILVWANTQHLLEAPSHEQAIQVLDEFMRRNGERLVRDPMKRALLQRDLWALFDWSAGNPERIASEIQPRAALQRRLVAVIKRLALSAEEIGRLPDNYAQAGQPLERAGLPRGLFASDGDWLLVGRSDGVPPPEHTPAFDGRSVFLVFAKFPDGREQARTFLKVLREFVPALVYTDEGIPIVRSTARQALRTNPATPQFPAGTQWALVRRMNLIDDRGSIRATRVIESIQVRSYISIPDSAGDFNALRDSQSVTEFQMSRDHLPALRAVEEGEKDFPFVHFRSMGVDPFETGISDWERNRDRVRSETLKTCRQCHLARGILSVNTYSNFGMSAHKLVGSTLDQETNVTLEWKSRQYEWGLLSGLWRQ